MARKNSSKVKLPDEMSVAIADQQARLLRIQSIVLCIQKALEDHFGDWPSDVPPFNEALAAVSIIV